MIRNFKMTSLRAADGGRQRAGSLSTGTQYNPRAVNKIPLPSGSIASPVTALKSIDVTQAMIDGLAMLLGLLVIFMVILSLPLSIFLLLFATF